MKLSKPKIKAVVLVTRSVIDNIRRTIGALPAESGGVLGKDGDGVIRHYHFDASANLSAGTYSPDTAALKRVMKAWNPQGTRLAGFVHSHPRHFREPSHGDRVYAARILDHNPELDSLVLPIVQNDPDNGEFDIEFFRAVRANGSAEIEPVSARYEEKPESISSGGSRRQKPPAEPRISFAPQHALRPSDGSFGRVSEAYDLDLLAFCRVIYVGLGGAREFAIQMARTGVGEHVLIDPDHYQSTNIGTQDCFHSDMGKPKVGCVAERIRDVNPEARVWALQKKLDELDDRAFRRLALAPWCRSKRSPARFGNGNSSIPLIVDVRIRPAVTLICGLTDDFYAQARVNRLALNLGLPSLCAQLYERGQGAEITFTYPGLTSACHRCILGSRYRAYLDQGFQNDVTSDGTPIFATSRLNALKGMIALAQLHHGRSHTRWGPILTQIASRNLIQIRMDPAIRLGVFGRVFSGGDQSRIYFDEAVWLPQQPNCPANGSHACPDCGGTGDLRDAIGKFSDTRLMPSQAR